MHKYYLLALSLGFSSFGLYSLAEDQKMDSSYNYSPYLDSNTSQSTNTQTNIQANTPTNSIPVQSLEPINNNLGNTSPDTSKSSPIQKVSDWVSSKRKYNQTGKPQVDLANQRIRAGKARLKAVKDKEKLDKYIMQSQADIQRLTKEAQDSEAEAALIENQVRFQESNQSAL